LVNDFDADELDEDDDDDEDEDPESRESSQKKLRIERVTTASFFGDIRRNVFRIAVGFDLDAYGGGCEALRPP
jgi:hypothetical protein